MAILKIKRQLVGYVLMTLLLMTVLVYATEISTTVTFVVPSALSHSLGYAASCSSTNFACVENDTTKDGTQTVINISETSGATCQTGNVSAITVHNTGNSVINVTANITSALPTGVVMKASQNGTGGYNTTCQLGESANPNAPIIACKNISNTWNSAVIVANLTSTSGSNSTNVWFWCDFSNFYSGKATGTSITRTLKTAEWASGLNGT